MRARSELAALVLAASALAAGRALAQPATDDAVTVAAAPGAPAARWRGEVVGGVDGPLGNLGTALVVEPRPWLAVGGGFGAHLTTVTPESFGANKLSGDLAAGVFARANVLRTGRLTLGPVVTASLTQRRAHIEAQRPQFVDPDNITWTWSPAPRFDLGLGAELALGRWALRLEGGLGVVVGQPTCRYAPHPSDPFPFVGSCDSPSIPAEYHFSRHPGRLAPYLTLGVARAAASPEDAPPARQSDPRADFAVVAPTALTVPKGTVTLSLYELLLLRATIGVSDRVQLSLGLGLTLFVGFPAWDVGLKVAAFEVGRLHLAFGVENLGLYGGDGGGFVIGGGPIATYCLDDGCASMLSTSVLFGSVTSHGDDTRETTEGGVLISPSVVLALGQHLKAAGEVHIVAGEPRDGFWAAALRLPWNRLAFDLGAAGDLRQGDLLPLGSVSLRW